MGTSPPVVVTQAAAAPPDDTEVIEQILRVLERLVDILEHYPTVPREKVVRVLERIEQLLDRLTHSDRRRR